MTQRTQHGLTLIEVVVAMGIFSIILIIIISIFSQFVISERRDIGEQELQEDIRFALELLSREIRTAYAASFALQPATEGAGPTLIFRDQNGVCVAHRLHENTWERAERHTGLECDQIAFENFLPATGHTTALEQLDFRLPVGITDNQQLLRQGFVTVIIRARARNSSTPPLTLQTSLTSRQLRPFSE